MDITPKTPWHIWVVGIVATIWNFGGALDYTMTQTKAEWYMGEFTQEQLDYFYGFPAWADAVWALGVWGAFIGSLLILLRSKWAVTAFCISLLGLVGSAIYQLTADVPESLSSAGVNIFMAVVWISIILLIWYTVRMKVKGILR